MKPFTVRVASWREDQAALAAVRRAVFVVEQRVAEEQEWDGLDAGCRHVVAENGEGHAIGTGRLLPDQRIGRMAVLKPWRGQGVGSALLKTLIALAREAGYSQTRLHAQTHALAFYARHGYAAVGDEFMEAGIPHREMVLRF